MSTFSGYRYLYLIGIFLIPIIGCKEVQKSDKEKYTEAILPDLNLLFKDYEELESKKKYAVLAKKIEAANKDLRSSEIFMEAASLYDLSGDKEATVSLIHKAIDQGMANPKILKQFTWLRTHNSVEASRLRIRLDSLQEKLNSPSNFKIEMRAMDHFWPFFESARKTPDSAKVYLKQYVLEGPPEVKDYYAIRYYSLDHMYGQMINGSPEYYEYLKDYLSKQSIQGLQESTSSAMRHFKTLYPQGVFPKVFIVPGLSNSGGTVSEMGLFIGGDMYGRSEKMPVNELSDWQKESIADLKALPQIIIHELMHFQQNYGNDVQKETVLYKILEEGICDFVTELVTGKELNTEQLEYLRYDENFNHIIADLQAELYSEDLSSWLYNGGSIEDRPHDLGYALGYLIAKSYYQKALNKEKALESLLTTNTMEEIIEHSDYAYLLPPINNSL